MFIGLFLLWMCIVQGFNNILGKANVIQFMLV